MTLLSNLCPAMCDTAKWAFTTRRIDRLAVRGLSMQMSDAKADDLILCEIAEIGHHKKIQLAERRVSVSYRGDLIVLCLGDPKRARVAHVGDHCRSSRQPSAISHIELPKPTQLQIQLNS